LTTLLGFVRILADPEFRIGTRKADAKRVTEIIGTPVPDHEINDAPTPTPEFYIARYLVTVAQFRGFVEATGFEIGDARALRDPDSRPVCWVSWHEARAYCDWLNKILGHLARAREHRSRTPRARGPMADCIAKRAGVGKGRSGWSARIRSTPGVMRPIRIAQTITTRRSAMPQRSAASPPTASAYMT
jgi:hypothetical protein